MRQGGARRGKWAPLFSRSLVRSFFFLFHVPVRSCSQPVSRSHQPLGLPPLSHPRQFSFPLSLLFTLSSSMSSLSFSLAPPLFLFFSPVCRWPEGSLHPGCDFLAKVTAFCPPLTHRTFPRLVLVPAPFSVRNGYLISGSLAHAKWGQATLAVAPGQSGPLPGSPGPPCNRRFPAVSHCPAGNFADAQGQFGHFVPVGPRRCLFWTVRRACACGLPAASWEKWGIAEHGEWSPAQPALSVSRLWLANARHGIASGFGQFSLTREGCLGEEGEG